MTDDPITAALQQLADHHEQLTRLTELITGIGDTLREHDAALAKLAKTGADPNRYRPSPPAPWWKLAAAHRQEPTNPVPKYDLDISSMSLVKLLKNGRSAAYPDLHWEPKQAFRAVADYYAER